MSTPTENPDMIRVAIVDDHPVARYGIQHALATEPGIQVVCDTGSVAELAGALPPGAELDLIILDLYLDGDDPALPAVTELAASTKVLVMSASGRPGDVLGAIQAGASGYITKHSTAELIVSAVETVAAGAFLLSSELADILHTELRPAGSVSSSAPARTPAPALSRREEETLSWVARGFTHAQIATRMRVSKSTVDTYIERIRVKLQVGNKAELTRAALERLGDRLPAPASSEARDRGSQNRDTAPGPGPTP